VTLVFQGLTLPWVIRKIRPESRLAPVPEYEQEILIQKKIAHGSLQFLDENYSKERSSNKHINILYEKYKIEQNSLRQDFAELKNTGSKDTSLNNNQHIYLELLEHQRKLLNEMNRNADFDEELIRKYFTLIDLEEFKIREKLPQPEDRSN
jgi:CPA1 family monovalent cation:H+ antiporter